MGFNGLDGNLHRGCYLAVFQVVEVAETENFPALVRQLVDGVVKYGAKMLVFCIMLRTVYRGFHPLKPPILKAHGS